MRRALAVLALSLLLAVGCDRPGCQQPPYPKTCPREMTR